MSIAQQRMERHGNMRSPPRMRLRLANDGPSPHAGGSSPPKRFMLVYLQHEEAIHAKTIDIHQHERALRPSGQLMLEPPRGGRALGMMERWAGTGVQP